MKSWRREKYDRLVELGAFEGEVVELIGGQLIVAEPQGAYHPARPVLAVEVADPSLEFDRAHKRGLYGRAQIANYWMVNLRERVLEVYREPAADAAAAFGWRYGSAIRLGPPATIAPLACASRSLAVADLLP